MSLRRWPFGSSRRTLHARIEHDARERHRLLTEVDRLGRELDASRADAEQQRARATELARHVRFHEDRYTEISDARDRITEYLQDASVRVDELLEQAYARARRIEDDARESAEQQAARILARARREAADVDREVDELRAYRTELEASIRAALARFEHSLDDLVDGRARPRLARALDPVEMPHEVEQPATLVRPVPPAAEASIEVPRPRSELVTPLEAVAADHPTAPMPAVARIGRGPTRTVELAIIGVDSFRVLSDVELSISALPGVQGVWIREYDGATAHAEVHLPADQLLAPLLVGIFDAQVIERSANDVQLSFGEAQAAA